MRKTLSIFLLLFCITMNAQIRVVDKNDNSPVANAQVFAEHGRMVGITDNNGLMPKEASAEKRLWIQHISYKTTDVKVKNIKDNTIELTPNAYNIDEVNVSAPKHDYLRIRGYFRYYAMVDSVPQFYCEGIEDQYVSMDGKKTQVKVLVQRKMKSATSNDDDYAIRDIAKAVVDNSLPDFLKKKGIKDVGVFKGPYDTDAGFIHTDANSGITTIQLDYLAFNKDHKLNLAFLKLLGITMNTDVFVKNETFSKNGNDFPITNFMNIQEYSRWFMKTKKMPALVPYDFFGEFFATEHEFVSKETMKQRMKDSSEKVEMKVPDSVPQLIGNISDAVSKMTEY